MSAKQVIVIGASAPDTLKVISAINRAGEDSITIDGFLDDDCAKHGTTFMGYPVLGAISEMVPRFKDHWVVNNIARDMKTRQRVASQLASLGITRYLTLIHPSVDTQDAIVGHGCIVQEGVVLGACSRIGNHCVLYAHAVIGHETVIGDLVFVANNAIVGARGKVGTGSFVGLNSVILPYIEVGAWSSVGAGSVVLKDVPPCTCVFGNPARAGVRPSVASEAVP